MMSKASVGVEIGTTVVHAPFASVCGFAVVHVPVPTIRHTPGTGCPFASTTMIVSAADVLVTGGSVGAGVGAGVGAAVRAGVAAPDPDPEPVPREPVPPPTPVAVVVREVLAAAGAATSGSGALVGSASSTAGGLDSIAIVRPRSTSLTATRTAAGCP